jgi:hypothetical protein
VGELYRFCGSCGLRLSADEEPQAGGPEDSFASWWDEQATGAPAVNPDAELPRQDEAPTESIPTARRGDTAVLPTAPSPAPAPPAPQPPPAPAPAPAAPAPAVPAQAYRRPFPGGATVAALGALTVIISALLAWTSDGVLPRDVPFRSLIGPGGSGTGPSLGLVLLAAGAGGALVALATMLLPFLKFLRRLMGLATLAVPVLFAFRLFQAELSAGELLRLPGLLGAGAYTAAVGAFVEMVAGRWFRR